MIKSEQVWDRHSIKAELARRGLSLTLIAKNAGLYKSACRQGLSGESRRGAEAIADALGIPFRTLFPNGYVRNRHNETNRNSNERCGEAQKTSGAVDIATRAA